MTWNIITDSSSDLTKKDFLNKPYNFEAVPLKINVGEVEFVDDSNIDTQKLLDTMKNTKQASCSACPSPEDFADAFLKADNSLCITISSNLSGTHNSACVGRDMVLEKHPEKNIYIFDSRGTAGKMVLFTRKAEQLIADGKTFAEICPMLEEYLETIKITFSLATFDNLVKTGRMSPITGIIATALKIRAVAIATDEGTIEVVKKVRGEAKTLEEMVLYMASQKDLAGASVVINHCYNQSACETIKDMLCKNHKVKDVTIYNCRGLTSFYAMDKGIIISY